MFIRQVKKQRSKSSKVFYQYSLVQSFRIDGKVRQKTILYLGSDKLLFDKNNRSIVLRILKNMISERTELIPLNPPAELERLALRYYEKYLIRYKIKEGQDTPVSIPPLPQLADMHHVDLNGLEVENVRSFGAEHLCAQILGKLDLKKCLKTLGLSSEEIKLSLIGIASRAIFAASEFKTSQILEMNSELKECYHYRGDISHKHLYAIADKLYEYKDKIDNFLYTRVQSLFNLEDKIVIFDISNTYFETSKRQSEIAKFGRSKEKRNDCPIVVFTGVINAHGFIRHSKIYEGNKSDSDTLEDMLDELEAHTTNLDDKTVVIDAGIATEDNLKLIDSRGLKYVCVSRKRIKDYPAMIEDENVEIFNRHDRLKVELHVFSPDGYNDTWIYVRSQAKELKESSMKQKLMQRYEEELIEVREALHKKGGTKKIDKVWERIGRKKEKHKNISSYYDIQVEQKKGKAIGMHWKVKPSKIKDDKQKGIYFLRTNYENPKEKKLWDIYNLIREVESTFRCLKSDLNIRPVHHQRDHRIQSHVYLTILAYQLVNTIRHMLKEKEIRYDWKNILRILSTHTIQDVTIPTDKQLITLRKPSKPMGEVQQIFNATECSALKSAVKKSVVYH